MNSSGYSVAATSFAMIGKVFISMAFSIVYVYSSELFPTELRSEAVATHVFCARVANLAAAFAGQPMVC